VGYLSHLVGDVIYPLALGGGPGFRAILWPLVPARSPGAVGTLTRFLELFEAFLAYLATPAGAMYVAGEALLLGTALVVWVVDGAPGPGLLRSGRRGPTPSDGQ